MRRLGRLCPLEGAEGQHSPARAKATQQATPVLFLFPLTICGRAGCGAAARGRGRPGRRGRGGRGGRLAGARRRGAGGAGGEPRLAAGSPEGAAALGAGIRDLRARHVAYVHQAHHDLAQVAAPLARPARRCRPPACRPTRLPRRPPACADTRARTGRAGTMPRGWLGRGAPLRPSWLMQDT